MSSTMHASLSMVLTWNGVTIYRLISCPDVGRIPVFAVVWIEAARYYVTQLSHC